ncbi:MAG: RNA methyltransferase, partial [Spirochaetales bacterium]|nr:RNA methyltransferase [Spirochaetales bacterium]
TRLLGKKRKYLSIYPEELAIKIGELSRGTVSIVFGRESDGLTAEELSICNIAVKIPSSPAFPSLNLAQAVQVIAYSLFRAENREKVSYIPIDLEKMKNLMENVVLSLEEINFFKKNEKEELRHFFTDIFMRAGISLAESEKIEKNFKKIAGLAGKK